jgi:hypothetical protein
VRTPTTPFGGSAVVRTFVASVAGSEAGVAEEARTRGFAAPAFAGCALLWDGTLRYDAVPQASRRHGKCSRNQRDARKMGDRVRVTFN